MSVNEASVAVLDCSKKYPNVYFDTTRHEWIVHSADSKCFSTEKDLLDLCRLVYPKLNVRNLMRADDPVKFTIYGCTNGRGDTNSVLTLEETDKLKNCSKLKTKSVYPYKCLHGEFQAIELFIPPKCQFQHLYSNDACQTQDHWNLLSIEKCKASNSALNTSMLLQWCDAETSGISTFSGIEFVCCPEGQSPPAAVVLTTDNKSNQQLENQQILSYIEDEDIDDDDSLTYDEDEDDETEPTNNKQNDDINLDDYNSITLGSNLLNGKKVNNKPELVKTTEANFEPQNQVLDLKDENSVETDLNEADVRKLLNTFDVQEQEKSDREAVDGTDDQKKEYEKQKQLIITSIQASLNNVSCFLILILIIKP